MCYLAQWLEFGLHDELILAELAAACVRALDPLLQAGLMDKAQAACAVAWCDQRTLVIPLTVTDPTHTHKYIYIYILTVKLSLERFTSWRKCPLLYVFSESYRKRLFYIVTHSLHL